MENNNIDKTFNEASKTLEEPATFPGFDKVWATVEERLDKKEEKKRIFPAWISYGIAASLLIGSGIFYFTNEKDNVEITKPVIAQNRTSQKVPSVAVPENIQKIDNTVKANIQNEILPSPPAKIAFERSIPTSIISLPAYETAASLSYHEDTTPAVEGKMMDSIKRQNIEEVIAQGIRKEKTSKINSVAWSSSEKKKVSNMNMVSDTAEVIYPNMIGRIERKTDEPEILTYNKSNINTNKPIVATSGFADKIGNKADVNSLRGYAPGVNINSISGNSGSGKVDISISFQGSLKPNMNPLIVIDGAVSTMEIFGKLDPKRVESVKAFKGKKAIDLFGTKATYGAIVVETKDISRKERRKLRKLFKEESSAK